MGEAATRTCGTPLAFHGDRFQQKGGFGVDLTVDKREDGKGKRIFGTEFSDELTRASNIVKWN